MDYPSPSPPLSPYPLPNFSCKTPDINALLQQQSSSLQDPETNNQQLSQDMPLSQMSTFSFSLSQMSLFENEEPLSQATQWLAAFQDSQEAWILDDILLSPEPGVRDATDTSVCVCVFIKLHITTQSGPVILVILCHSH